MNSPVLIKQEGGRLEGRADSLEAAQNLLNLWMDDYPVKIKIDQAGSTLDYKAIFWIWMRSFAKQMTERGRETTPEELHDIFCHSHLGYVPERKISKTVIRPALRTITYPQDLTRPEFYHFMRSIEQDAHQWGMTIPENESQYDQDKAKEDA